jgi:hypothetical protein
MITSGTCIEFFIALGLVVWWNVSKDSDRRKSPQQRERDTTPNVLLISGKVVDATGLPGLGRRDNCQVRCKSAFLEIYKVHDLRPSTFVGQIPYPVLTGLGWRNRQSLPMRASLVVGSHVGPAYLGTAVRLPSPPRVGYTTLAVQTGARTLVIESQDASDQALRQTLLQAIKAAGGDPKVETYGY